jgi:hypothetical protein
MTYLICIGVLGGFWGIYNFAVQKSKSHSIALLQKVGVSSKQAKNIADAYYERHQL